MTQNNQHHKPPENFTLTAQMDITFDAAATPGEAGDGKAPLPRFSMIAYTGGTMRIAGWRYPIVVDLAGLAIPSQARPIRFGHDANSGVGHSDSIRVEGGNLIAAGVISRDTAAAREVVASSKNGFPWQASIGASVEQFEFVKEKAKVLVNGREFTGPVNVVRKSVLGEISFVDLGADGNTSASVAARMAASAVEAASTSSESSETSQNQEKTPMTITAVADETKGAASAAVQAGVVTTSASMPEAGVLAGGGAGAVGVAVDPIMDLRVRAAIEQERIAAVRKACGHKHAEIAARAIREGWDQNKTEVEVMRAERPKGILYEIVCR